MTGEAVDGLIDRVHGWCAWGRQWCLVALFELRARLNPDRHRVVYSAIE